jgi:phosphoribosyl 1,2-cyclic phosphodiesterase
MTVRIWGTRGSIAASGPDTARYGGNTACVEVRGADGTVLVLDAGTGVRRLGGALVEGTSPVHVLITHLHLDHIVGLGFFAPLYVPRREVHLWLPASTTHRATARLARYLSPPLFPVGLRDLPCRLALHEVPCGDFAVGPFRVSSALVSHPGPTVGYRLATDTVTLCYLPDHEPALGLRSFPLAPDWTSGHVLAEGVDLLIHDAQYTEAQYWAGHVGWGHSSIDQALAFGRLANVRRLVAFHHDPAHADERLERMIADAIDRIGPTFPVTLAAEGATFALRPEVRGVVERRRGERRAGDRRVAERRALS